MTKEKKKAIKDKMREFIWDIKQSLVAWHKLVQPIKAGGLGLIDIDCALDAQKVSILKHMKQKRTTVGQLDEEEGGEGEGEMGSARECV